MLYWNGHRVMGVLAMSRAIGDHCLRPYVIPEPEVRVCVYACKYVRCMCWLVGFLSTTFKALQQTAMGCWWCCLNCNGDICPYIGVVA